VLVEHALDQIAPAGSDAHAHVTIVVGVALAGNQPPLFDILERISRVKADGSPVSTTYNMAD